ncbi:hypothetical protein [Rummeliibacillus pycnus]|uniref:hypothetical protein n=1 Tax=Rummeliibacillus pycnus TaxID=101070 RepID=UPI0037CBF786
MHLSVGEHKINRFLHSIVSLFKYDFKRENPYHYIHENNGNYITIQYVKKKKLLSKVYHFTLKVEKHITVCNPETKEARYNFRKGCWNEKMDSEFGRMCNQLFQSNYWKLLDIEMLCIRQVQGKYIFEMNLLPGSYTSLILPPMAQGIPMYHSEVQMLENIIEGVLKQFEILESYVERGVDYA